MKNEIILEVNRFNTNMLMNLDEDGDGSYEESSQQKTLIKNSKSQSSVTMSNEQVRKNYVVVIIITRNIELYFHQSLFLIDMIHLTIFSRVCRTTSELPSS